MVRKLLRVKLMVVAAGAGAGAAVLGRMRYGEKVAVPSSTVWLIGQVVVMVLAAAMAAAGGQWVGWVMEKRRNKVPGPMPFPVIGNLLHVAAAAAASGRYRRNLAHVALANLGGRYGPLFHLQLGVLPVLIASTPSAARLILSHHDPTLSNRPPFPSISRLFYHPSKSAFMCPLGDPWRFTRKFYSLHLLNPRYVHESHLPSLVDETLRLIFGPVYAASLSGAQIDLSNLFYSLQRCLMYRAVFGKRPPEVSPELTTPRFHRLVMDADAALGSPQIGTFVPALRFLHFFSGLTDDGAIDRCHHVFDAMLERALCEREIDRERQNNAAADPAATVKDGGGLGPCILDKLLALDPPLDRERMKAMMLELVSGGSHTTALALDWTMAELLSNERVMKKAVEELDGVVGKERMVSIEDVSKNKLPYIKAIVKETLRLHPTAPLLIPRMAMAPCQLKLDTNTYQIAANTLVLVNAWAIGRDEATWGPTALVFSPERFLDGDNVDLRGQNFGLVPFGAGRRICPGLAIAIPTLELTIATFLHCFHWSTAPGTGAVDMSERPGLTLPRRSPLLALPTSFRLHPKLVSFHSHLHLHSTASTPLL